MKANPSQQPASETARLMQRLFPTGKGRWFHLNNERTNADLDLLERAGVIAWAGSGLGQRRYRPVTQQP